MIGVCMSTAPVVVAIGCEPLALSRDMNIISDGVVKSQGYLDVGF
jgi:hypothetical protein